MAKRASQFPVYTAFRDQAVPASGIGLTMEDVSRAGLPDGRPSSFDVRSWLAGLGHYPLEAVRYVTESERAGRRTVTYDCAGTVARVRMSPVGGGAPAWELVAELPDLADRVVLPGGTHFVWRAPRGTHA